MDLNSIAEPTSPDTQVKLISGRDRTRDEVQVWVDGKVTDLVTRWTEAGTPEPSEAAPFLRLEVSKEERPELRRMVNRAFTLISGKEGATAVVPAFYQDGKGTDGKVTVKFNVRVKPEKPEGTEDGAAEGGAAEGGAAEGGAAEGGAAEGGAAEGGAAEGGAAEQATDAPKPGKWGKR